MVQQKSVLTIAAVGDLWSYTVLSRADYASQIADADESNPDGNPRFGGSVQWNGQNLPSGGVQERMLVI